MMEDVAILTGRASSSAKISVSNVEKVELDDLGRAKKIVIDKQNTTIVEGNGKQSDVQGRINQIRKAIEETTSDYDARSCRRRLAKLAGGVAVIPRRSGDETEMKKKKARVEDALHATARLSRKALSPAVACIDPLPGCARQPPSQGRRSHRRADCDSRH